MPQFDVSSFFNQGVWLGLIFCIFYFLVVGFLLPDIVSGIKTRYKKEKSELALLFQEILSSNKTTLSIEIKNKLSTIKPRYKFKSAL